MTRKALDHTLRQRRPSVDPTKAKNAVVSFAQLRRGVELQSLKVTGAECLDDRAPTRTDPGPLGVKSAFRFCRGVALHRRRCGPHGQCLANDGRSPRERGSPASQYCGNVASQVGGLAHGRRIGVRVTRYFLHGNVRCNARNRINSMGSSSRHEPLVGTPSLI